MTFDKRPIPLVMPSFLTRRSLRDKLTAAFGLTLLLLVIVAAVGVTKMGALSTDTRDAKTGAILDEQIMSMEIAAREALSIEAGAILEGVDADVAGRLEAAWASDDGDAFDESLAEARRLAVLDMPSRLVADEKAGHALRDSVNRTVELVKKGDIDGARANRAKSSLPAYDTFVEKNQAVEAQAEEFSEAASTSAAARAASGKRTIIVVTAFALLIGSLAAFFITRGVTRGAATILDRLGLLRDHCTTDLASGLDAVADGDLTRSVTPVTPRIDDPGHDEIGRIAVAVNVIRDNTVTSVEAYNRMREQLAGVLGELSDSATTVSSASQQMASTSSEAGRAVHEIAAAVGDVAQGAERQVRMVESTRAAVQDASRGALSSAETARETSEAADHARRLAREGVQAAEHASEAIREVAVASHQIGSAIGALSERSDRIGGIVTTITAIAEQTNLLALNAAIEAARAGDQGKGFAVVAEEVRKLAEESQTAAAEISGLIAEMQSETGRVVGAVADGAKRTEDSVATVSHAREAFESIGTAIEDVSARVAEIAAAVAQISHDAERAAHDVAEVAGVAEESSASAEQVSASTQETSASTQEIAASAENLATTAHQLRSVVARFTVR
jgi:methyl-accepting chemotaxis protein